MLACSITPRLTGLMDGGFCSWLVELTHLDHLGVHGTQVASLLHGDDLDVVLVPHPHKERLVLVVEDASPRRPVAVGPRRLPEPARRRVT